MFKSLMGSAVLAATVFSGSVYANTTAASFADVAGSAEFNGWNSLISTNISAANLVAGYGSNVANSGDAVLTRISGSAAPYGAGLYQPPGAPGAPLFSTFTLTDATVAANLTSVVFQSSSAPGGTGKGLYDVSLTYTVGGINYIASLIDNNAQADTYKYFSWDLSNVTGISAISVQFSTEQHASSTAFQLDQVAAAVPEPSEYALLLAGLALVGVATRRKQA